MARDTIHSLSIQWHITARCGNRCRHCYMYDGARYEAERQNEMDLAGLLRVLDSIAAFEEKWEAKVRPFAVSGGDPLLHPDWAAFMRELKARGKVLAMMGNPETLTEDNLAALAELGLQGFQLSLDGLESTHDYFRGNGSFQRTVEGIHKLSDVGVPANVMFTLYPENRDQLIPLMRFVAEETPAARFTFDIGTCAGNAGTLDRGLDSDAVKAVLKAYLAEKERLIGEGRSFLLVEKNKLLQVARFEEGTFFPASCNDVPVVSGCYVGWTCVPILSDGTVLACRRFPLEVGKMPEQTFEDIFLGSETLKRFRRPQFFAECSECDFYQHCRGCPAVTHGLTGDPFAAHPFCFRRSVAKGTPKCAEKPRPIPLDTTLEEEHDLVASHFGNLYPSRIREFLNETPVQAALLRLSQNGEERRSFSAQPDAYLDESGLALSALQRLVVAEVLRRCPADDPDNAPFYRRIFDAHLRA